MGVGSFVKIKAFVIMALRTGCRVVPVIGAIDVTEGSRH